MPRSSRDKVELQWHCHQHMNMDQCENCLNGEVARSSGRLLPMDTVVLIRALGCGIQCHPWCTTASPVTNPEAKFGKDATRTVATASAVVHGDML